MPKITETYVLVVVMCVCVYAAVCFCYLATVSLTRSFRELGWRLISIKVLDDNSERT